MPACVAGRLYKTEPQQREACSAEGAEMAVKSVVLLCFVLASLLLAIQSVAYARELTEANGLLSLSLSLS